MSPTAEGRRCHSNFGGPTERSAVRTVFLAPPSPSDRLDSAVELAIDASAHAGGVR
jgi:hypothetical protein